MVDLISATIQFTLSFGVLLVSFFCAYSALRLDKLPKIADLACTCKALINRPELIFINYWSLKASDGWDWPGQIAVVTGGCSGIGHSIVKHLIARKVKVAILDVRSLPEELAANSLIRFYECDITSRASVVRAANGVRNDLGHASILVNNAGIASVLSILDTTDEHLQNTFNVNYLSHWMLVQEFLPHMIRANRGHIMTVASMASFLALHKGADYSASKAAVLSFHESLSMELKHVHKVQNVLTSVAHPSFVQTPMTRGIQQQADKPMLDADYVAGMITEQIFRKRSGQLIIPKRYTVVCSIRGWPTWLQMFLRDYLVDGESND